MSPKVRRATGSWPSWNMKALTPWSASWPASPARFVRTLLHGVADEHQRPDLRAFGLAQRMGKHPPDLGFPAAHFDAAHERRKPLPARNEVRSPALTEAAGINKLHLAARRTSRRRRTFWLGKSARGPTWVDGSSWRRARKSTVPASPSLAQASSGRLQRSPQRRLRRFRLASGRSFVLSMPVLRVGSHPVTLGLADPGGKPTCDNFPLFAELAPVGASRSKRRSRPPRVQHSRSAPRSVSLRLSLQLFTASQLSAGIPHSLAR